jgi:hypothetical protein
MYISVFKLFTPHNWNINKVNMENIIVEVNGLLWLWSYGNWIYNYRVRLQSVGGWLLEIKFGEFGWNHEGIKINVWHNLQEI